MERILQTERLLQTIAPQQLTDTSDDIIATLRRAKEDGFSDAEIEKYGMDLSLKTIFEDFENHWEFSRGKEN